MNHADLDIVRPPRVQHELHQGTPGVTLARSGIPQLKHNTEIITICSDQVSYLVLSANDRWCKEFWKVLLPRQQ